MIRILKRSIACVAVSTLAFAIPATAQELPVSPGAYWDVSSIDVIDGQDAAYIDFLASRWKASQEFAKKKGYIDSYHVLTNDYRRDGEPDLYLVVVYKKMYDTAEQERQRKEYEAFMRADQRKLIAESGGRAVMRKQMGTMLLREWTLK